MDEDKLCEIIGEYDALLVRSQTKVTAKIIEAGKNLKIIGRAGVGVDNIDVFFEHIDVLFFVFKEIPVMKSDFVFGIEFSDIIANSAVT